MLQARIPWGRLGFPFLGADGSGADCSTPRELQVCGAPFFEHSRARVQPSAPRECRSLALPQHCPTARAPQLPGARPLLLLPPAPNGFM